MECDVQVCISFGQRSTNITLFGVDDVGARYHATCQVTFIGGVVSNLITIGIITFVVVVILVKYGSRILSLRKTEPRPR